MNTRNAARVLFLRMEPAGYTVALARSLKDQWAGKLDVVFVNRAISQSWEEERNLPSFVLPAGREVETVRRMIRDNLPDLVHCAGWGAPPCRAAINEAHRAGIPVVVDLDTWRDAARGLKAVLKRFFLPRFFRKVTHFAPGGRRQAAFLHQYGVDPSRITTVNMTVDVLAIQSYLREHPNAGGEFRRRFGLPADVPVVLFLARMVPQKGIHDLLQAWETVRCRLPDAQLVFVGDGELTPLVKAASSDRLHALGRLSGEEVWQAYAAADVFVAPSRIEPWGLTVNEAMAADVPVIITDAFGCIGDLAIDAETASIVPAARPDLLADALERIITDLEWRERLRAGALARIEGWTIEEQAHRIRKIWEQCLRT